MLCYGSGASCSHGTGAYQVASEATAWLLFTLQGRMQASQKGSVGRNRQLVEAEGVRVKLPYLGRTKAQSWEEPSSE